MMYLSRILEVGIGNGDSQERIPSSRIQVYFHYLILFHYTVISMNAEYSTKLLVLQRKIRGLIMNQVQFIQTLLLLVGQFSS